MTKLLRGGSALKIEPGYDTIVDDKRGSEVETERRSGSPIVS